MISELIRNNEINQIKDLLEKGKVDLNLQLHIAASAGHSNIVKLLLSYNPDLEIKGTDDYTPFHYAVSKRHSDVIKLLIEYGADVNTRDSKGKTPLFTSITNFNGKQESIEIMKTLLELGADQNIKSNSGVTFHQYLDAPFYKDVKPLFENVS